MIVVFPTFLLTHKKINNFLPPLGKISSVIFFHSTYVCVWTLAIAKKEKESISSEGEEERYSIMNNGARLDEVCVSAST